MLNRTFIIFLIFTFLLACRSSNKNKIVQKFLEEYTIIKTKYDKNKKTIITRDQNVSFQKEKTGELEQLLKKYAKVVNTDDSELLKGKVLIEVSRFKEAGEKIDYLIDKKSSLINEAKMAKVQILIYQQKPDEAHEILKTIEGKVKPGLDLLSIYLYFVLYSQDNEIVEEYGKKFLNFTEIPRELIVYEASVYRSLSAAALRKNDLTRAKKVLEKGISIGSDLGEKLSLEDELVRLQLIEKTAPTISAETWINSKPLKLEELKGKVVVIDFWAAWCNPCRMVIPLLIEQYNKYKNKGLVIIGLTKLYGKYSDDTGNKGIVAKTEEINLVKAFVKRNNITYPSAIDVEGINSKKYKITAVPTIVFINQQGKVVYIEVGAGQEKFIKDKIKELLEEK